MPTLDLDQAILKALLTRSLRSKVLLFIVSLHGQSCVFYWRPILRSRRQHWLCKRNVHLLASGQHLLFVHELGFHLVKALVVRHMVVFHATAEPVVAVRRPATQRRDYFGENIVLREDISVVSFLRFDDLVGGCINVAK